MLSRRAILLLSLVLLAGFVALRAWDPLPVQIARHRSFDFYQRLAPAEHTAVPVIVDVDEASIADYGQWPWPRTLISDLIDRIAAAGPAAIAFNVVFAEPDRSSPRAIAELSGLSPEARAVLATLPDSDAALAATLGRAPSVLGQPIALGGAAIEREGKPRKASIPTKGADPRPYLPRADGFVRNLAGLEGAAAGLGVLAPIPDADEVVRRPPLVIRVGEDIYPSLALETIRVAVRQRSILLGSGPSGLEWVRVGPLQVPTDDRGRLWLRFDPHRPDLFVSARDVLAGTVPADRFAGRIVLLGVSAAGIQDVRSTPIDPLPTVEIQAQALATLMGGRWLSRPPWTAWAEIGSLVLIGALLIVATPWAGPVVAFVAGFATVAVAATGAWLGFADRGLLLDVTYIAGAMLLLFTALTSLHFLREQSQRRRVRTAFAQYLAPAMVEKLAENPGALRIGGEMRPMTVLFSDVRGFTAIAERLRGDPRGLTRLVNLYFTAMTDRILEFGGTIDKYMGDATMAFWNAPLDDPEHAAKACRAALEMLDGLRKLNRKIAADPVFAAAGVSGLEIGIGLNTGECLVGNVGSEHRFNYSVLGDPVNVAARLEGQSRGYGVRIVLGEATREAVPDLATLELDLLRVRGRAHTERVFALLGGPDLAGDPVFAALRERHGFMLDTYRAQDWPAATAAVMACREALSAVAAALARQDVDLATLYDLYAARIATLRGTSPIPEWDGVFPEGPSGRDGQDIRQPGIR